MTLEDMGKWLEQLTPEQQAAFQVVLKFATNAKPTAPASTQLEKPADGIGAWVNKLKSDGYSEQTVRGYQYTVTKILREEPKPTAASLREYFVRRLEQDRVGAAAIRFDQKALKGLFTFLYDEQLWPDNPMAKIKPMKEPKKEREVPTDAQVAALLYGDYHLRNRANALKFRTIVAIICSTGFRLTEAASILRANLNLGPHLSVKVMGKGGKERTVPLSPNAAVHAAQWLQMTKDIDSPYLFPGTIDPQRHWDTTSIEEDMKRACEKMGIKPVTPHQLRHWWATRTLERGGKLEIVSKLLGHARLDTTSIYRHISQAEMDEDYRKHAPA